MKPNPKKIKHALDCALRINEIQSEGNSSEDEEDVLNRVSKRVEMLQRKFQSEARMPAPAPKLVMVEAVAAKSKCCVVS